MSISVLTVFNVGALMFRLSLFVVAFIVSASCVSREAQASRGLPAHLDGLQGATMEANDVALAPLPFVRFCMDHGRECEAAGPPGAVIALTADTLASIDLVNRDINRRIRPVTKSDIGGFGRWAVNPSAGDCNDYAVSKRHELIIQGLPASALLLAVARTSWGEGHLLLIARTDKGDLVLDNLVTTIRAWHQTDYAWIKRQSPNDPMRWEAVSTDGRSARIAAAIQRSRALAAARAEKRREARLLLAGSQPSADTTSPQVMGRQDRSLAMLPVSLGFDTMPAWASSSVRLTAVAGTQAGVVVLPAFVQGELTQQPESDPTAVIASWLSIALLTGADWSTPLQPFKIAFAREE